jgi:hypothetical protein
VRLPYRPDQFFWGVLGATAAAAFAIWMIFFPDSVAKYFAWDVHPRMTQLFIGAGYIFRTAFFLSVALGRDWSKLRWMFWGNLAFTGTLLLATFWHADEFNWDPAQTPVGHLWLILYIFEPVTMLYMVPRGVWRIAAPTAGGPLWRPFRWFLIATTGLLLSDGLLMVINPEFLALRWPWDLTGNPLDARIMAAWFLGWAAWCATMAFAGDWLEIRLPAALFILNGAALTVVNFTNGDLLSGTGPAHAYRTGILLLTLLMAGFAGYHEVRRVRLRDAPREPEAASTAA